MLTTSEQPGEPLSLQSELRRLREEKRLPAAVVAEAVKCDKIWLLEIESGRRKIPRSPEVIVELDKFYGTGRHLLDLWAATQRPNYEIIVTGDNSVINTGHITHAVTASREPAAEVTFPEQRQRFHFNYLNRMLTHSTVMFWVSVGFMILGGVIILTSGALITFRDGGRDVKLVTGLSGALITTAGGVLHRQARQKEARVAQEAGLIAAKIDEDDRFEKATALIDRIDDSKLKDQLKTTATLTQLGLKPDANEMARRLFPTEAAPEITGTPESDGDR